MKTTKLTTFAKLLILILCAGIVVGGYFAADHFGVFGKKEVASVPTTSTSGQTSSNNVTLSATNEINLAIDEKFSWKPVLDANGGLTTQPGSIYDKAGLKVNIKIVNNETGVGEFTSGKVVAFANSVNGYAAMYKKFQDAGVDSAMPYIVDNSNGGDGVIVRGDINNASDFIGKKIGVPNMSSDQTILLWLLSKSDVSKDQFNQIKSNIKVYNSVSETAKAFFSGEVDIAGVRQPFLTQAKNTQGSKVLFTTKIGKNLIVNGIIFRKDYMDKNPDAVKKFIDGALQAVDQVKGYDNLKVQPSFKNTTDEEFKQMATENKFSDYTDNVNYLGGTAQTLFEDMSNVWQLVGTNIVPGASQKAFTKTFIDGLSGKYSIRATTTTKIDDTQKQKAQSQGDEQALLKKSTTINFQPNSANFLNSDDAAKFLDEFVNIAKFLDGAVIQIEGNVANVGTSNEVAAKKLSEARANTVARYLQEKGIDASRFIVVGNGISKQIGDNNTTEGQMANRRTDVFFKVIE